MQDSVQRQILNALLITLRPLARILLRAGVGHREFNEISKAAFVDVATKDYGLRGRPTNISRVAVMTGLTRKEVRRIRDKNEAGESASGTRAAPMGLLLHRWYTESDFLNEDGTPREIPFDGEKRSFSELVRRYGGDIPPGAMRTELKRIGAIEEVSNGKLRPLKRNISNRDLHNRLIDGLTVIIYPALVALANNTDDENTGPTWVMRTASTSRVRENDVPRVRRIGTDRLTEFVESIDDLFVAYETLHDDDLSESSDKSVGVGVFYFEEKKSDSMFFDRT